MAIASLVLIVVQTYKAEKAQSEAIAIQKELRDQNETLKQNVERARLPIRDVSVSFRVNVPLEHPALASYRARLEKCAESMALSKHLECGAAYHTIDISGQPIGLRDFCIPTNSELCPNRKTEPVAFSLLSQVDVIFRVFKSVPSEEQLSREEAAADADLYFVVNKALNLEGNHNLANNSSFISICYEIDTKTLFAAGTNVPAENWRTNGTLSSVLDLSGAFLIIRPKLLLWDIVTTPEGINVVTDASKIATEISHSVSLREVTLNLSGGYQFVVSPTAWQPLRTKSGIPIYLARLTSN